MAALRAVWKGRMIVVPSKTVILVLCILIMALALVPLSGDKYWVKLVTRMMVLGIFAMSLDLIVGYTGLVSFGHAAFFGLAAYTLHLISPEDEGVNLLWALPTCLLVSGIAAALIGALCVRTRGIFFIMVTLAIAQMLFYFFPVATICCLEKLVEDTLVDPVRLHKRFLGNSFVISAK